jgi:tetratricopeptide (TPR) repeat protein
VRANEEGHFGVTPGELLAQTGDVDAAIASFERAGDSEPAPALAARAYELAARATSDPEDAARWLDRAIARAPRATAARWARVRARLSLGRLEDALADVEHLEALARGTRAKHEVLRRAGDAWRSARLGGRAAAIYERALRYAPNEPEALAGLGAALVSEGRNGRGVSLLGRALEIAQAGGASAPRIALDLARALAEGLDDLPTAVAHAAAIPSDAAEAPVARGLEGRWRARLGDLVGAGLAFARLRDLAASLAPTREAQVPFSLAPIVELLVEGAELERTRRADPLAAQRHLAAALRLEPRHPDARRMYREVGVDIARRETGGDDAFEPSYHEPLPLAAGGPVDARDPLRGLDLATEPPASDDDVERAARADELARRLQGDPGDDEVADELASLLEALGRGHELVALLSARMEDATPERRAILAPRAASALERLAVQATAEGRVEEAALYREAAAAL